MLQEIKRCAVPSSHKQKVNPSASQLFYARNLIEFAFCDIRDVYDSVKEAKLKLQTIPPETNTERLVVQRVKQKYQ